MYVEFDIQYDDMDLLNEFVAKLAAREKSRDEEAEEKWVRHFQLADARRREMEPTEADVAAVEAVLDRAEQETVIEVVAEPEVTEQEATDALHQFVAKKGAAAALSLFAEFGAKRLGDVPGDKRAALVARMKESL